MNQDQEQLREFVVECREGLDRMDSVLVALEATPGERTGLDIVFRTLHTIKGNCGFLNFPRLGAIAHAGESLLSKLFSSKSTVQTQVADVLLKLVDTIRQVLLHVEATGNEGDSDHHSLIEELRKWTDIASGKQPEPTARKQEPPEEQVSAVPQPVTEDTALSDPEASIERFSNKGAPPSIQTIVASKDQGRSNEELPTKPTGDSQDVSVSGSDASNTLRDADQSTYIRVQIDHLDDLMNLVGELVLVRNRILQVATTRQDDELTEPIQRLHRLTASLQDGVLRTRMQPVRNAWRKYPRIVRDLAKQCGKLCEVELQGGDTELDKSMLEAIADPLVHLVRNSIDHGIEKPYLRRIKGKPETGRLLVRAFQESGQVHIEVSDDGAGLDLERIRRKAVEAGVVAAERAHLISESELKNSVFLPGFTTTDRVTSLSGRGVGMDVVKTCVEQIGGTIELETQKDVGTTIRLTVPLTLAIVPAVIVRCGTQRFAVPHINVVEMLRLRGDEEKQACENFHDSPVLRLRGELLPKVDLAKTLGISAQRDSSTGDSLELLILKTGTRRFALLVNEIGDAQEIVVKPLGEFFASQTEYSGAALMGDGSIALILNVIGIARATGVLNAEQSMLTDSITIREEVPQLDEQVLVCRIDGDRQIALPLDDVVCLERVSSSLIERAATGHVIQLREQILPLYPLSRSLPASGPGTNESDLVSVVVYRTSETLIGLVVDQIIDVAQRPVDLRTHDPVADAGSRDCVIGTSVILGRITDFLRVS
jgi:two-component system chemotaxis sensor kinase CheA